MKYWRFMDYSLEGIVPRNLTKEWMLAEDGDVQAEFDSVVNILETTQNWRGLYQVNHLYQHHVGLTEIRFDLTRTKPPRKGEPFWRYRPVGFLRPATNEFVFLRGCKKWMETYEPLDCFDSALVLKQALEAGRGTIHDHIFSYLE